MIEREAETNEEAPWAVGGPHRARFNNVNSVNDIVENLWRNTPDDVLWLSASQHSEEIYRGSQSQMGIKKDGAVVWGYYRVRERRGNLQATRVRRRHRQGRSRTEETALRTAARDVI